MMMRFFLNMLYNKARNIMEKHGCPFEIVYFDNSGDFIQYCRKNVVDIILADIDMPNKNGFFQRFICKPHTIC